MFCTARTGRKNHSTEENGSIRLPLQPQPLASQEQAPTKEPDRIQSHTNTQTPLYHQVEKTSRRMFPTKHNYLQTFARESASFYMSMCTLVIIVVKLLRVLLSQIPRLCSNRPIHEMEAKRDCQAGQKERRAGSRYWAKTGSGRARRADFLKQDERRN